MDKKWKWGIGIFLILVLGFFALPFNIATDTALIKTFSMLHLHSVIIGIAILGVTAGLIVIVGDKK